MIYKRWECLLKKKIFSPNILNTCKPDRIVILTDSYEDIRNQIVEIFTEMKKLVESKIFFINILS